MPKLNLLNLLFFFFNDTATTEIYTLSLHDALPISGHGRRRRRWLTTPASCASPRLNATTPPRPSPGTCTATPAAASPAAATAGHYANTSPAHSGKSRCSPRARPEARRCGEGPLDVRRGPGWM